MYVYSIQAVKNRRNDIFSEREHLYYELVVVKMFKHKIISKPLTKDPVVLYYFIRTKYDICCSFEEIKRIVLVT